MRKKIVLTFLVALTTIAVFSQKVDTVYKNHDFIACDREEAFYYGIRLFETENIAQVTYRSISGVLYRQTTEKKGVFHGSFKEYFENGARKEVGNYNNGKRVGEYHYYDVLNEYVRTDIYKRGRIIAAYYKPYKSFKVYTLAKRQSSYGKYRNETRSFQAMGKFISDQLIKPAITEEMAEPVVVASFLITPDGSLENIEITGPVHPQLDQAVVDVINKMPKWTPAKYKGKNVYSEFSIAVSF